jgi:hypothetical protein
MPLQQEPPSQQERLLEFKGLTGDDFAGGLVQLAVLRPLLDALDAPEAEELRRIAERARNRSA